MYLDKESAVVKTSMSHEDYLEAIVMLGGTTEVPVRSVDVANKLGVSKASVNKAISALKEQALVIQPHYGDITLTDDLRAEGVARELINRIQNIRKSRGYEITDKIVLTFAADPAYADAIDQFGDYISRQVLATEIKAVENFDASKEGVETLELDELNIPVDIALS